MKTHEKQSIVEANGVLGRSFFAAQDRLRGGPAPELCAPQYRAQLNANPPIDRAGHEQFSRDFYAGFLDLRHEIEQVIAAEDAVVVRFVLHGMHTGPVFGIPATHKRVAIPAHVILRVQGGKVNELFGIFDQAGMLTQLGVLPAA